jgi:hypothetical protein
VRAAFELIAWAEAYYKDDQYLEETAKMAKQILIEAGSNLSTWELVKMQLPCKTHPTGMKTWASGGEGAEKLPAIIRPMTANTEKMFIETMIAMRRDKLALDLEPHPCLEKTMGSQSRPKKKVTFMVVGGSNAHRLTKAIDKAGHSACRVINTDWRITPENCRIMAEVISKTICDNDPTTVVLQFLDSSMYYVRGADGTRELPQKDSHGKYHVKGELMVASYEQQTDHFNALKPILDVIGKRQCLIVAPMPRFIIDGCCKDARYVSNRLDPFFQDDQLDGVRCHLKAYMYNHRRGNVKVVDPAMELRGLDNEDIWFVDPIHPIDPIYRRLATAVITMAAPGQEEDGPASSKRRRTDSGERQWRGPPTGAPVNKPRGYTYPCYGRNEEDNSV